MAKATALDKVRRVRQRPKPKSQSAPIGPDGPKHPGNRQLCDKRGRPDAGAHSRGDLANPKAATFCAALWLTFTLPLTAVVVVVVDEDADLPFQVAGQEVVFQQHAILHGLMPARLEKLGELAVINGSLSKKVRGRLKITQ